MNLGDFRTRISGATGLSMADSSTELALIDSLVNEAVVQWLVETKMNAVPFVFAVSAGSGDYNLDQSVLSFTDAYYVPADGSQSVMLQPVDSADIRRMRLLQTAAPQAPYYYALQGENLLLLYPSPASDSDALHIIGTPTPNNVLSTSAETPSDAAYGNIPAQWHPALESYCKWKAADYSDNPKAQMWMSEWDAAKVKARVKMNTKGGTRLPRAVWGRRGRYPLTPGTDTGA